MASSGLKRDKKAWKGFAWALNAKGFQEELRKQVSKSNRIAGNRVVKAVRAVIRRKIPPENHALTIAIKRSRRPLIDFGDMINSITYKEVKWDLLFVGVLRTDKDFNVAVAVHDGTEQKVTRKMRLLFAALSRVSDGEAGPEILTSERAQHLWERYKKWRPIKKDTHTIVIPKRPFMTVAFADPKVKEAAKKVWLMAVFRAFRKRSARGKKPKLKG